MNEEKSHVVAESPILNDGVGHDIATSDDLARYRDAQEVLSRFKVPALIHASEPHDRLYVVAFDGTGNNKYKDPAHATNIAKISDQIDRFSEFGHPQIDGTYVAGPGTQSHGLGNAIDTMRGHSYEDNIEVAYRRLIERANRWMEDDPEAKIRVVCVGFSRGASQVPGCTNLIHERGIPDLASEVVGEGGDVSYTRHLVPPGKVIQAVGLFDPVATGVPMQFDRRLPPSVVSGLQLTAENELRASFPSDQIIPPGLSEDGRFLNISLPGAHSDIGGGYLRKGLSDRCGNLMIDYCNAFRDESYLTKHFESSHPGQAVIHKSIEGEFVFKLDPRSAVRGAPSGTNTHLAGAFEAQPTPLPHQPRPADPSVGADLERRYVRIGAPVPDPERTVVEPNARFISEMEGRSVSHAAPAVRVLGAVGTAVDTVGTIRRADELYEGHNDAGGDSHLLHFVSRNAAGWTGAESFMAVGAAAGVESGPGAVATGAIGFVVGAVAGDKVMDAYDEYRITHQKDPAGNTWRLDEQSGWVQDRPVLPGDTAGSKVVAEPELSRRLSFQSAGMEVQIALSKEYTPRDPYRIPASPDGTQSERNPAWVKDTETHEWSRTVVDARVERGMTHSHVEHATSELAAALDRRSEEVIRQNVMESPLGVAERYRAAYEQQGWKDFGHMPEPVQQALHTPTEKVLASDGHQYTHEKSGEWTTPGMIYGKNEAPGRMLHELDASERVAEALHARSTPQFDGVQASAYTAPAVPSNLKDPDHPDHAFFQQARGHVVELDKSLGRSPDQHTDNLASALVVQARSDGLSRIDQIALSTDGQKLWAVQMPPGRTDHLFDLRTNVATAEAMTPPEQSAAKWPQAMQQFEGHQQEVAQSQQRAMDRQQQEAMEAPGRSR